MPPAKCGVIDIPEGGIRSRCRRRSTADVKAGGGPQDPGVQCLGSRHWTIPRLPAAGHRMGNEADSPADFGINHTGLVINQACGIYLDRG